MFKNFFLIISLSFCFIKSAYSHSHYPITKDDPLKIEAGKLLYNQYCASCHQVNLAGAKNWKGFDEDGHRKAPPLNGTGHTWHHSDELLHKIIKHGFAKLIKNYEGKMMGFGDNIEDEGIDNILSYIKSYWNDDIYFHQLEISKK
jgi:mono/diheme cytochrome c family protein